MAKITMYPRIQEAKNGVDCEIESFLRAIIQGRWKDEVQRVRQGKQDKKSLPYVTISGTFEERKESGLKEHSGRLAIDIDSLNTDLDRIKESLKADKYTEFVSKSVGGNGLFVLVKIPGHKHKEAFQFFKTYYKAFYDIDIDKACKDVSRPRIVSYDPEAFYNKEAKPLELPDNVLEGQQSNNDWIYNSLEKKILEAPNGERHNERLKAGILAGGYIASGAIDEAKTLQLLENAITVTHDGTPQELTKEVKTLHQGIEKGLERPISPELRPVKKEVQKLPEDDFLKLINSLKINLDDEFDEPKKVLEFKDVHFATAGNIVTVTGKAKSRKSSFLTFCLAAYLKGGTLEGFRGTKIPNKPNAILYDTEQDSFYIHRSYKRTVRLSNVGPEKAEGLQVFKLRGLSYKQRKEFIEKHLNSLNDVGLVCIDGIKDIVGDINDQTESTETVDYLLRLADQNQFNLMVVLHQNKGNTQERGALGTELQNKSETVLEVVKDEENSDISIVRPRFSRHKDIEEFAFSIDENGLPTVLTDYTPGQGERELEPQELPETVLKNIAKKTFEICKYDKPSPRQFGEALPFAIEALQYNFKGTFINKLAKYFLHISELIEVVQDGKFTNLLLVDDKFNLPSDLPPF